MPRRQTPLSPSHTADTVPVIQGGTDLGVGAHVGDAVLRMQLAGSLGLVEAILFVGKRGMTWCARGWPGSYSGRGSERHVGRQVGEVGLPIVAGTV